LELVYVLKHTKTIHATVQWLSSTFAKVFSWCNVVSAEWLYSFFLIFCSWYFCRFHLRATQLPLNSLEAIWGLQGEAKGSFRKNVRKNYLLSLYIQHLPVMLLSFFRVCSVPRGMCWKNDAKFTHKRNLNAGLTFQEKYFFVTICKNVFCKFFNNQTPIHVTSR